MSPHLTQRLPRPWAGLLLSILLLPSCRSEIPPPAPVAEKLELHVFDCGRLHFDHIEPFFGIPDEDTDVRDFIVPCYVIEHEKGRLLWEGGLPSELAADPGWREMEGGWRMRLDQPLAEQLAGLGLSMDAFEFVAFSHFHFDHVGVANELTGATLLIQRPEFEAAFASEVTVPGFDPEIYNRLAEGEKIILDGEYDIFGDGRVRLLSAPGHTPGHQVLFVDLEETGPIVLSGDLYVLPISRREQKVLTVDLDPTASEESMGKIESLIEETGAELWIGHDLTLFERLTQTGSSFR